MSDTPSGATGATGATGGATGGTGTTGGTGADQQNPPGANPATHPAPLATPSPERSEQADRPPTTSHPEVEQQEREDEDEDEDQDKKS